jgi:urease gamma subunit
MPTGNSAQKLAARRVQNTLQWNYTRALRAITEAKTEDTNWGQAADTVIAEQAGPGFPEVAE